MNPIPFYLLITVALTGCANRALAADWPKWRGPNGNGITTETVAPATWGSDGPRRLWKASIGVGFTAATVANGRVYTMGHVGKTNLVTLWCLAADTGKPLWQREWTEPLAADMYEGGANVTPVLDGDRLFIILKPARVLCLDATSGKDLWDHDVHAELKADCDDWGILAAPLVAGDKLIINYGSNGTALDKTTGQVVWTTGKGGRSYNVPAIAPMQGEPTVLFLATNAVVALRLKDGAEQWRVPFGQGYFCHAADPVLNGDSVYVGSADYGGQVIRFASGQPETVWKGRQLGNFMASSIVRDGYLYGINLCDTKDSGAELKCVDWKTGEVKWAEKGFGWGSFIMAGDQLVLLSDKGELSVARASPEKFDLLARFQLIGGKCWTPPTLANGRLYLRNAAGDLVCYDVGASKAG